MYRNTFNSRKATAQELDAYRRSVVGAPPNAEVITREEGGMALDAVVYRWQWDMRGRQTTRIAAFCGKRTKPDINEYTPNPQAAERRIEDYFRGVAAHARYRAERRAAHRQVDMAPYAVGAILHASGGYDMTWNEYFQIVAVKGRSVVLRPVASEVVEGYGGYSGQERPVRDAFVGDGELTRRVTANGVKVDNYKHAHVWDGRPNYFNCLD